jgi:chaperonin GroEL
VIKACAVRAPGFGDRRKALLQDMAVLTGGTVISSDLGLTLAKAKLEHLGRARRIEIDKDSTTIIGGAGDAQAIHDRVAAIRKERDAQTSEYERKQLDERIAKLAGGVALLRARRALEKLEAPNLDQRSGITIVQRALEEPLRRIVSNAADEPSIVLHRVDESTQRAYGYNAATREYGDMLEMGVIDPAKVTRLALQNAASIASLVLTTDCMIANAPPKKGAASAESFAGAQPEMY